MAPRRAQNRFLPLEEHNPHFWYYHFREHWENACRYRKKNDNKAVWTIMPVHMQNTKIFISVCQLHNIMSNRVIVKNTLNRWLYSLSALTKSTNILRIILVTLAVILATLYIKTTSNSIWWKTATEFQFWKIKKKMIKFI